MEEAQRLAKRERAEIRYNRAAQRIETLYKRFPFWIAKVLVVFVKRLP